MFLQRIPNIKVYIKEKHYECCIITYYIHNIKGSHSFLSWYFIRLINIEFTFAGFSKSIFANYEAFSVLPMHLYSSYNW